MIGALPKRPESAGGGHDRVVVHAVAGADLRDLVGHAGPAGHAVAQSLGAFENAVQHALGGRQLPQHVHVDAAATRGLLISNASLMDAAADRECDQLLVTLAARASVIDLRDQVAVLVVGIGVDARKGTDTS